MTVKENRADLNKRFKNLNDETHVSGLAIHHFNRGKALENGKIPIVYFLQGETSGLIKIGYTTDVVNRVRDLRNMNADRLRVLGIRRGTAMDEQELHHHFRNFRDHGEWFRPGRELLDYIENWCVKLPK